MKKLSQEEAAKVLEDMKVKTEIPKAAVTQWKRNTALDMAVEALKYSEIPNSSDCISRQAAIDAVEKESQVDGAYGYMDTKSIVDLLNNLPSAQPEIIHCRDCMYWNSGDCHSERVSIASQEYWFGDMKTEPDHYCGYAERREDDQRRSD